MKRWIMLYFTQKNKLIFIHPYDDIDIIEGQSTIGYEIAELIQIIVLAIAVEV